MASMVRSSEPCAVIRITSVSGESALTRGRRSMPLPSGRRRSMKTRSKGRTFKRASASAALRAVSTLCPRSARTRASASAKLGSSSTARIRLTCCGIRAHLPPVRQPDPDGRARAGPALDGDRPAVLLDHLLREGHPEPEPPALRGVEGLENLLDLLLAHPGALVADEEVDEAF